MQLAIPAPILALLSDLEKPLRRRPEAEDYAAAKYRKTDRQMAAALVAGLALFALAFSLAGNPRKAPARNWRGFDDTNPKTAARMAAIAQADADNADRNY